jgi:hypothetical protein
MTLTAPTDDLLERIADAQWNRGGEGITFRDIHQMNACNHVLSGTIEDKGVVYGFVIEMGDLVGTEVREWGLAEDVGVYTPPPPPEPATFIPRERMLWADRPEMFKVYLWWRKQPWFAEKERAYAYDRHFQPGGLVESHYRDWAAQKGMVIGLLSELPQGARDMMTD